MSTEKRLVVSRSLLIACMAIATISTVSVKGDFTFGALTNLGPTVNSPAGAEDPEISVDGLKYSRVAGACASCSLSPPRREQDAPATLK